MQHPLRKFRRKSDLTIDELAKRSHIGSTTIFNIESGKKEYLVHHDTAKALADALNVDVLDIFQPFELSHRGRPPHTGKPLEEPLHRTADICPGCFMELPRSGVCDTCTPAASAYSAVG